MSKPTGWQRFIRLVEENLRDRATFASFLQLQAKADMPVWNVELAVRQIARKEWVRRLEELTGSKPGKELVDGVVILSDEHALKRLARTDWVRRLEELTGSKPGEELVDGVAALSDKLNEMIEEVLHQLLVFALGPVRVSALLPRPGDYCRTPAAVARLDVYKREPETNT